MNKYFFLYCFMLGYSYPSFSQLCRLNAHFEENTSNVILDWNMISQTTKTTYVLLRSTDKNTWTEIITDKYLQNYTEEDVFDYNDKVNRHQKYFYRVKIIDISKKTIIFSNIANISTEADREPWVVYPNPVNNVLAILFRGQNAIKGVINVAVQENSGKTVIRFRAASNSKKMEIPVSRLRKGIYTIRISILNEIVMNQKFVKQ